MTPWAVIDPARLAGAGLLRTQSDERLVDLVRAGNDRAFEAIVHRYQKSLLRHCRKLLPAGRAEDAVQQAFLRALEGIRADTRDLQLGPWLHRIAHNLAIDSLRRPDSHWDELDEHTDRVAPPDQVVEGRTRFRAVVLRLDSLPERQRRALVLRELEGRSYEEIAAALGASGAGVRQLLNRARNAMRAGATALVPPALLARVASSPTGVNMAELVDAPGASALVAKGSAAVAAAAMALVAVTATQPGEHVSGSRADRGGDPPAREGRAHADGRAARAPTAGGPTREDQPVRAARGLGGPQAGGERGAGRGALGPAGGAAPGRGERGDADDEAHAGPVGPDGGGRTESGAGENDRPGSGIGDDDGPGGGGGDDGPGASDDDAASGSNPGAAPDSDDDAAAGADDGSDDGGGSVVAGGAPGDDGSEDDGAEEAAAPTPLANSPAAAPTEGGDDDDGGGDD